MRGSECRLDSTLRTSLDCLIPTPSIQGDSAPLPSPGSLPPAHPHPTVLPAKRFSLLDLWAQQLGESIFSFVDLPVEGYSLLLSGFLETQKFQISEVL